MSQSPKPTSSPATAEIEFSELWLLVVEKRLVICSLIFCSTLLAGIYSFLLPERYISEVLLTPVENRRANNPLLSEFGFAAGIVGIEASTDIGSNVVTALATIQSREFIIQFIREHGLLVPIFASRWNKKLQTTEIEEDAYDPQSAEWLVDQPSENDAFKELVEAISVSENQGNGLVTVSLEWRNPEQAQTWLSWMIQDINNRIKMRDLQEATEAIEYLQEQLQSTQLVEMRRAFYQLIESQTRIVMLTDVRNDYVLRTIDPAYFPDEISAPNRGLIVALGFILGISVSLLMIITTASRNR